MKLPDITWVIKKTDFLWCLFRLSSLEMILWDRFGLPVVIPFDVTSGNSWCPEHCPANWRAYEETYSLPLRQGKTKNSKNYHHIHWCIRNASVEVFFNIVTLNHISFIYQQKTESKLYRQVNLNKLDYKLYVTKTCILTTKLSLNCNIIW